MVNITGLSNIQSVYKGPASGNKGHSAPQHTASKQDNTASLPNEKAAQDSAPEPAPQPQVSNREFFSKVHNLKTGEEQVLPSLDSFSYFEAIRGNQGIFIEKNV